MEKPITLRINELRGEIVNACNDSKLPPFLLEMIVGEIYRDIQRLANVQAEEDRLAYSNYLVESALKDENDEDTSDKVDSVK